jgi:hypothetical protein
MAKRLDNRLAHTLKTIIMPANHSPRFQEFQGNQDVVSDVFKMVIGIDVDEIEWG